LSHPNPTSGHSKLSGVGLYFEASFFNHNARPNVSRWAIGDIMCFVTNQDIPQGQEACISYLEHDILCETVTRRNRNLDMDFQDVAVEGEEMMILIVDNNNNTNTNNNAKNTMSQEDDEDDDGPTMPVVDSDLQNELMAMNALERLESMEQLLQQARGISSSLDEDAEEDVPMAGQESTGWFQCDIQNLNILKAITLDGLGQTSQAVRVWEECISFTESKLPPLEEASVVVRIQAALCWMHLGDDDDDDDDEQGRSHPRAKDHAKRALYIHDKLFGGGAARLRRRYRNDFELCLRKGQVVPNVVDLLWPV
jgi:SET domain